MKKILYLVLIAFSSTTYSMEKEKGSSIELSVAQLPAPSLNEQEKHTFAQILFNRYRVTEAFAGLIAQNHYLNKTHTDLWVDEIISRCSTLERLENESSERVKALLKLIDTICLTHSKDYCYQTIAPLLQIYHFNTHQWDTCLHTLIAYYKEIRTLAADLKQEFATSDRKKRKFLSNLKRAVDILNEIAIKDPYAALEKAFSEHHLNIGNKENLHVVLDTVTIQQPHLKRDKSVFDQFDSYYEGRKNISATEKDILYYIRLCRLREMRASIETHLNNLISQVEPFQSLLSTIDTLSPYQCYVRSPLPLLNNSLYKAYTNDKTPLYPLRILMDLSEAEKATFAQTIRDHLVIARNFCYLNTVYKAIENAWSQLPLYALEQKLKQLLLTLQTEQAASKLSAIPRSTESLEQECKALTLFIAQTRKNIWRYVKERLCKSLWQEIQEAATCLLSIPPQTMFLLECYKLLEQPLRGYNHEAHAHALVKEWQELFKDKVDLIIILDYTVCPYITHVYTTLSGHEFPLTLCPPQEKLSSTISSVKRKMESYIQVFTNQSKEAKPKTLVKEAPATLDLDDEDNSEENYAQQVSTQPIPVIKQHILSLHEHMQLKEQAQKRFIPVVTLLYESDEKVVLRNWRGYSSSDNVTLTLYKIPKNQQNSSACTFIVNPHILKKYRDSTQDKWDIYHSFTSEVERKFLVPCALVVSPGSPLAQQLGLKSLDATSYALCIRACIEQTNGYIVYLINKTTKECFHRFFHADKAVV